MLCCALSMMINWWKQFDFVKIKFYSNKILNDIAQNLELNLDLNWIELIWIEFQFN